MSRPIDADALEKAISLSHTMTDDYGIKTGYEIAMRLVENAPTIEPEPKWIPVSERLPEKAGRYLITRGLKVCNSIWNRVYLINYSDLMGLKSEKIWWNGNVGKSDFERIYDVIAWMPLPEPYREEGD